jgi:hypothetical protein
MLKHPGDSEMRITLADEALPSLPLYVWGRPNSRGHQMPLEPKS